jgi:hypothetical protein
MALKVLLAGLSARAAGATEIKVLCFRAMRAVLQQRDQDFAPKSCLAASIGGAATDIPWRRRQSRAS